ncbi:Uncharacterized protein TPAR_08733 [Tolypocladium paradoxum]|uniref:Monooxygenase n=1 Tax=Tolypocladium paradoxum TaxID=94208 RepID=A0A2S4KLS9_9HYPO|nr:Uncharacterized protein TPAR_08733 [Tolypocladium paradoxum]
MTGHGDLHNSHAMREQVQLTVDPTYRYKSLAIGPDEDDCRIRELYRPFLLPDVDATNDWVAQQELSTVLKMVESQILDKQGDRLRIPILYGSLRSRFPISNRVWRYGLAAKLDLAFVAFKTNAVGNLLRRLIQGSLEQYMRRTAPPEYHDILVPDFEFGAKRPILDHGYLENPTFLTVVGPDEVRTDSGETVRADVIVLANGFKTQGLLTPMIIKGRNGAVLPEVWQKPGSFASAYMGVCVADFPNLFLLTGPNTLPSGHSTLVGIECSVEYILRLIDPLIDEDTKTPRRASIQVKEAAQRVFNNRIQADMQGLVYTADVGNWYFDKRSGRNTLIWPGTQWAFWWSRCIRKPNWCDFDIAYKGDADVRQ